MEGTVFVASKLCCGLNAEGFGSKDEISQSIAIERSRKCRQRLFENAAKTTSRRNDALTIGRETFNQHKIWLGCTHDVTKLNPVWTLSER